MGAGDVTGRLARYMVGARERALPSDVARAARNRILDTLAAIVLGSRLKPGELAIQFARSQGGADEATVLATPFRTSAVNAALANGMLAHADETNDYDPATTAFPSCSVIPAALAMSEREGRSGTELLRAVTLGYDLCCRFLHVLGPQRVRAAHRGCQGVSSTLGSVAAAASLARLDEKGMRHALSYAAQQVSGVLSWVHDTEHVEKAFDFGGMGARNGVTAAIMAQMGFSGVWDVFDCEHNVLQALSAANSPEEMVAELGSRYFVTETAIKPFSTGYPIQAPLDAFLRLYREHGLSIANVERIMVSVPQESFAIVNDTPMPERNCQHIISLALVKGAVSFDDSHSYAQMKDPKVLEAKSRVKLVADAKLTDPAAPRSGRVDVTLRDGRTVSHFTPHAPGTKENPMTTEAVNAKARDLMEPVLGTKPAEELIRRVNALEELENVRELRALFAR